MKTVFLLLSFFFLLNLTSAQSEKSIIESNNKFSFDIYKLLRKNNKSFVCSPASISSAIAMTYIGTRNNTFNEIANTFYFEKDVNTFSKDYKNLLDLTNNKKVTFLNSNSLWIQDRLNIEENFLELNKKYFSSSIYFTDFMNNHENSRLKINSWVESKTNNKIKDLIQPDAIDNSTRLVLVNALYFKAPWQYKFSEHNNTVEKFQIKRWKRKSTNFMNQTIHSWYYEDNNLKIVEIPYSGEEISMLIILPKSYKKNKKIEKNLDNIFYVNYLNSKVKKRIKLSLPMFEIDSEFNLNKTLTDLGIKEAFTGTADFSGISKAENLFINNVAHKATISVDENGTEATAATAVLIGKTSIMHEEVTININKPFIYIIKNNRNNCIYFIGKMKNPS